MIIGKTTATVAVFALMAMPVLSQKSELILNKGWMAKRAVEVPADGTVISSPGFELYDWMEAVVPGTVLTTLLHNGKIPDPFFGMNNELIPDIYETGADFYTYWFQNQFSLPQPEPGRQVWLKFRGINYSANIYLNGKRVNHDTHRGMFLRQKYLVTSMLETSRPNNLAVLVEPPFPAGKANGGQGGDGTIARAVTQQYTPGWDWVCPVRDRNTGIWDQVAIEITGPVDIRDPFVKTRVPGVRVPGGDQAPAFISVSADLYNASDENRSGVLVVETGNRKWSQKATVKPGENLTVTIPEIKMDQPELWWPNGMGDPYLYGIDLHFEIDGKISDRESFQFGIRQTGTYFDEASGGRVFLVNGQKVFIKGGNWISSDLLLRHTPERYDAEVRMHAMMNMNMIRIWGGSITERPEFYDACDKYGILVWQDLWVTGDCNGRWFDPMKKESQARRQAYPDDHSLFLASVTDQVKMLRNHPSLYLWCGGNEFPPSEHINKKLETEVFPRHDGTRYYLNESTSADLLRNTIGGNGDGPYGIQDPLRFFVTPSYPFNPEIGSVGVPNVEAMRKMMPEADLRPPVRDRANRVWSYHKYIGYGDQIERFGEIRGIEDFCKKAQVVNYEQYRALQEGFNAGMWNAYTGMLVWKSQNPWTSLRGQFYDVYLDQTGGFYGFMHGAKPIHVQMNLNDTSICVVNQTLSDAKNIRVEAHMFGLHGNLLGTGHFRPDVAANTWKIAGKPDLKRKPGGLWFMRLLLIDSDGSVMDENLYWFGGASSGIEDLQKLSDADLRLKVDPNTAGSSQAEITNAGSETSFFTRIKVVDRDTGTLILPVFFSDNYLTLFPGESKKVTLDLSAIPDSIRIADLQVVLEPWNGQVVKCDL